MHQGHNIPWAIIEANFRFIRDNKALTPHISGYFPRTHKNPQMPIELKHFIKIFVQTITDFSSTERAKYPVHIPPVYEGRLFSDVLCDKYPMYLNQNNQRVEYWIKVSRHSGVRLLQPVANILLYENEMEPLLMLARHPQIQMKGWIHLEQEHYNQYGFNRTKELSLSAYIFFSTAQAVGTMQSGEYMYDHNYRHLLEQMTLYQPRCSEQAVHLDFVRDIGAVVNKGPEKVAMHMDQERFERYLKDLFALLYRYDVLARECGIDPQWEREISYCYPLSRHVKENWDEKLVIWSLA